MNFSACCFKSSTFSLAGAVRLSSSDDCGLKGPKFGLSSSDNVNLDDLFSNAFGKLSVNVSNKLLKPSGEPSPKSCSEIPPL